MRDGNSRNIIFWFFLSLFILSIAMLAWLIWPFISIIILASVMTGIFSPVFNLINVKDKITPPFASFLTCALIFFVVLVPIVFFVGILSKEAHDLYITAKGALLNDHIKNLISNSGLLEKANLVLTHFNIELTGEALNKVISEIGKIVGLFLYEQARSIASNTLAFFANIFLMLLVVYFLLIDGSRLISFITDLSPLPKEQDEKLIRKFKDMAGAILIGNGLGGLIQGILGGTVFMLFGLKSPFLWGVIMALLAFLPIVGIGVVFIPAAIYLFLKGQIAAAIFFVIFYIILSGTIEYIFKPKIVGKRVKMHTLLVFFSIIGGLKMFGILGIIYGPLVVTAFLTLTDIYHASYRKLLGPKELK
ncbi:MAG: AI-2E family transporter [Desulfobacteraceae bacterium]|nr:AI-2E family transporter [Pseudomonadota bacterium]MBU4463483.1 AI-2E family transporter [Pseudomonadota bacterium]MCG2755508.1 AI-2E family transporter [Desulfobacteraceae bacterium]